LLRRIKKSRTGIRRFAEKRRTIRLLSWISIGLFVFFVLIVALFVYDFLNPDHGFGFDARWSGCRRGGFKRGERSS